MNKELFPFLELVKQTNSMSFCYNDLLLTLEWQNKRAEILERDRHHCVNCGKAETIEDRNEFPSRSYYIWYGKEKTVYIQTEDGSYEDSIPEIIYSDKPYWMEVHHMYYIINRLPWQYENEALITLCNWCHRDLHENETVNVYESDANTLADLELCGRCGGAGWIPEYQHIQGGICFNCRGSRYELPPIKIEEDNF